MGKIKKKIDNCYEVTGEWIVFLSSRNDREFLGENFCHEEITISKIELRSNMKNLCLEKITISIEIGRCEMI